MADPTIDEIKVRVDIADLVGQSVQLKKAGRHLKGLCPFHHEKTPSFVVYPDQGTFHCFGCGKSGDIFTWVQETQHLDFGEALRMLATRAGVALPERAVGAKPDVEAQAAEDALAAAATWYHERLLGATDAEGARRYLARRGVKAETIERFGLGWAPESWNALTAFLRGKGFAPAQLEQAGLARPSQSRDGTLHDLFRGRVLFPIRDAAGVVCGFGGRVLGDGVPKYLNSPQTRFFDKSATLYGLDLARAAIRKDGCAVIVEGYMDVVVPHQEGFANVVASLGTALTERQIELLRRYTSTIVLALDADAAGQAATLRGLEVARQAFSERLRPVPGPASRTGFLQLSAGQVKIATLEGGKDPDEIVREDREAWRRAIESAVPMADHKLEVELARVDPGDPQSKAAAVQEMARFLVQVADQIEWGHYADRIAQRLRLDLRVVQQEMARASRAWRQAERQRPAARNRESERTATARLEPTARAVADAATPRVDSRDRAGRDPPGPRHSVADAATPPVDARSSDGTSVDVEAAAHATADGDVSSASDPRRHPPAAARSPRDVTEEHLVSLLVQAPDLARRMPARLAPEDLRQPECRELYRTVLRYVDAKLTPTAGAANPAGARGVRSIGGQGQVDAPRRMGRIAPEWPGASGAGHDQAWGATTGGEGGGNVGPAPAEYDPVRPALDEALREYYDALVRQTRRRPPQSESQLEADLAGVVRRIKERNLRQRLLEAQYLLAEAESSDERLVLEQQVERLAAQLGRIQLEQSRSSLYTSASG